MHPYLVPQKLIATLDYLRGLKQRKNRGNTRFETNSIICNEEGKKALSLGRDAKPTLSTLVTGTDDIQVDGVGQVTKLGKDIKKTAKED